MDYKKREGVFAMFYYKTLYGFFNGKRPYNKTNKFRNSYKVQKKKRIVYYMSTKLE